ncbi:hypothetical protein [Nitrosomonas oligotropha]|uniref:hypothetical protein n=1 Tax=Nitrosomonas oligotropha TaxID=42354 RepID=UPI00136F9E1A|nr:hypothetical protein [Nitrosomonas oligotropha]MXS81767.1 hypothetical protein [Nitrosomonas oligotropha]
MNIGAVTAGSGKITAKSYWAYVLLNHEKTRRIGFNSDNPLEIKFSRAMTCFMDLVVALSALQQNGFMFNRQEVHVLAENAKKRAFYSATTVFPLRIDTIHCAH